MRPKYLPKLKFARRAAGRHVSFDLSVKPRSQAPKTRPTGTKGFLFLSGAAWVCAGALVKWDGKWLYALFSLFGIAAFWAGRRQSVFAPMTIVRLPNISRRSSQRATTKSSERSRKAAWRS